MFFRQSKFEASLGKDDSRGSGGKIFEILYGVGLLAFLVLFEQILIKLFAPHSKFLPKHDAFCSPIIDLCVLTSGQEGIQKILVGDGCNFEFG